MSDPRRQVRLRVLTAEDAPFMVALDREGFDHLDSAGWETEKLAAELEEGIWATEDRQAWAVLVESAHVGVASARNLSTGDGVLEIRLSRDARGRGVGREVLRQLADHHFTSDDGLRRLRGTAHEDNVAMQRAFHAAGFRMEGRFRDALPQPDGVPAAAWGYAITRADWEAGRHRAEDVPDDLHGLTFTVDDGDSGPVPRGAVYRFVQEGRRTLARYSYDGLDGELAGILVGDVLTHRYVEEADDGTLIAGSGRMRLQRRRDGRVELVDEWLADAGDAGRRVLVERR